MADKPLEHTDLCAMLGRNCKYVGKVKAAEEQRAKAEKHTGQSTSVTSGSAPLVKPGN